MITDKNKEFLVRYGKDSHREDYINDPANKGILQLLRSPLLSKKHEDMLIEKDPDNLRKIVKYKSNPSEDLVDRYLNSSSSEKTGDVVSNKTVSSKILVKAADRPDNDRYSIRSYTEHPNLNHEVISSLIKRPEFHREITDALERLPAHNVKQHVTDDHISKMLDDLHPHDSTYHLRDLQNVIHKKYGDDSGLPRDVSDVPTHIMDKMLNSPNEEMRDRGSNFLDSLKPHHIEKIFKEGDSARVTRAFRSKVIPEHVLLSAAKTHEEPLIRNTAKKHLEVRYGESYNSKMKEHGIKPERESLE